ncbi:MAG: hypothetical protein AAF965_01395 [Pseudomonadota bacterium]
MPPLKLRLLRISAVLWAIWGAVHIFAGVIIITSDATGAVQAVADAVDPQTLVRDYPAAAGALFNQHGWNLGWIGLVTLLCAVLIWRRNMTAVWLAALVGGLADIGYFVFLDLPGHVHFVPGTLMTVFSASAILLSFAVWLWPGRHTVSD